MCCNKEYPKLFCPGKNQRAVDYITDWIDSANVVLQAYGTDLLELQAWREEIERDGTLDQLAALITDVEHLKLYTVDGTTIDLSKLAAITELFTFDGENAIVKADIIPGDMAPEDFEELEPGKIPVRVDGVWYTRGSDLKFYVVVDGLITSELAPYDKLGTIALAWEAANAVPETPEEEEEDEENPFEESGIDENTRIAVTVGEHKYLRGGILFSGKEDEYLSGIGTFKKLPEIPEYGVISVTYAELNELIDNSKLTPGNWYRITDYNTIILSRRATALKTKFDIFALALSEGTLDENVLFLQNASDTYLIDCNVKAWRGKYCVKNDVTRFNFVNAYKTFIILSDGTPYVRYESADATVEEVNYYAWKPLDASIYDVKEAIEPFIATGAAIPNGTIPFDGNKDIVFTTDELPEITLTGQDTGYGYWEIPYGYQGIRNSSTVYDDEKNPIPAISVAAVYPVSKGVIFRLTDEFGNSAPYDFKSIQFTWESDTICGFTFSKYAGNNFYEASDASISNKEPIYNNVIGELYESFTDSSTQEYQRLSLNRILHANQCIENSYGVNTADIYILGECRNNRWSGNSGNNKFKGAVIGNYFYPEFNNNFFEISVKGNLIMENFNTNSFRLPSYVAAQSSGGVVPEFEFSHNTIGTNFNNNSSTMPRLVGNVFGKDASGNTFKGTVGSWTTSGHTYLRTLFTEDRLNLVGATIKNNFTKNYVNGGICSTSIGDNFINNELNQLLNCNLLDQIQECHFDKCRELIMGGHNINLKIGSVEHSTIDYGCSYLAFDIGGDGVMRNGHVHRGVAGTFNNIIVIPFNGLMDGSFVMDFVSNNHKEQQIKID